MYINIDVLKDVILIQYFDDDDRLVGLDRSFIPSAFGDDVRLFSSPLGYLEHTTFPSPEEEINVEGVKESGGLVFPLKFND